MKLYWSIFNIALVLNSVIAQQLGAIVERLLNTPRNDLYTRPNYYFGLPTKVGVQYRINSLFNVDPRFSTFQLDFFIRLKWRDTRLAYKEDIGKESLKIDPKLLWTPDIYIYNEQEKMDCLDETLKVENDGTVFWSRHFIAQLTTSFDLRDFPYDSQTLKIQAVSFSNSVDTLILDWFKDEDGGPAYPNPISTFKSVLWKIESTSTNKSALLFRENSPIFDLLNYEVNIKRDPTAYILRYIFPVFFISICATFTYWISLEAVPARYFSLIVRVGFSASLLIATISFNFVVSTELPKVNYASKMDIFILLNFMMVFISIGEFACAHYLYSHKQKELALRVERAFRALTPGAVLFFTGAILLPISLLKVTVFVIGVLWVVIVIGYYTISCISIPRDLLPLNECSITKRGSVKGLKSEEIHGTAGNLAN